MAYALGTVKRNVANILRVYDQATAEEIRQGLEWYSNASNEAALLHPDQRIASAIVAALSPGLRWERNIEAARRVIGREDLAGLGVRWYDGVRKAERILSGENPATVLKGNKVRAFWQCILSPINKLHVCIDGHAYAIWRGKRFTLDEVPQLSDRMYNGIAADYTEAASVAGILPLQMQAITWVVWRRLHNVANNGNGHKKKI